MVTRILTGLYTAGAMNNPSPTGNSRTALVYSLVIDIVLYFSC
jgi:hypothetical protein